MIEETKGHNMSDILMVVTAANSLTLRDGTAHPTGFWAEELVVAHRELTKAGHRVVIATPGGVRPPVDPGSLAVEGADEFGVYLESINGELAEPAALESVRAEDFVAIVLPGGHGPMADLSQNSGLGALLVDADASGILIAPFCHGPAGLLSATTADGEFAFAGRTLAVFTDDEELSGGLGENAPWFLEAALVERGAHIDSGAPWSSHVVRDGNLISGQNPQSSAAVAAALVQALA